MAISDKIRSIETHLRADYKSLEKLGETATNKNIENIAGLVDSIYDKFPKTSYAEGTEITLENTLKGKLDFDKIYQEVEYITSDGHSYIDTSIALGNNFEVDFSFINNQTTGGEQPIVSNWNPTCNYWNFFIRSNSQVDFYVKGHNFFNLATAEVGQRNDMNIKRDGNTFTAVYNEITTTVTNDTLIDNNTTLKILNRGDTQGASYASIGIVKIYKDNVLQRNLIPCYRISDNVIGMYDKVSGKFYTNAGTGVFTKGADVGNGFGEIVGFGQTSQEGTPTPETPIDIEVVKGNIEATIRGKNRLKFKTAKTITGSGVTASCNDNTTINLNGTSNGQVATGFELEPLKLVGTYKLSGYTRNDNFVDLYWKDKNGTIQFAHLKNNPTVTFNEGDTLYRIFVYVANGVTVTFNNETFNLQLEEGLTATLYEPYQTPITKQLSLGEYEFAKIGDYVDTIEYDVDEDKVYKNKAINKMIVDGSENWLLGASNGRYNLDIVGAVLGSATNNPIICSHFIANYGTTNYSIFLSGVQSQIGLIFQDISWSVETFKNWLSQNITYIYYALAEIIKEPITGTLKDQIKELYNSQSLNGTTIITSNGQLPLVLKVRALKGE